MINTYRYGGHKNLRENNTTQKLEVRPTKILEIKGPFIQVTITHPVEIQEELRRKGLEVSSLQANALIEGGNHERYSVCESTSTGCVGRKSIQPGADARG